MEIIRTKNVTKVFLCCDEIMTVALNKVSINVESGEFVAVMGPSGCGKTTLLNILGMLDQITSGEYWFLGEHVTQWPEKQRTRYRKANMGFVFQSFNLIEELSVFENVELPLIYLGYRPSERRKIVEEMLDRMQLMHRSKHFPPQLSGGQQQRAAIARAVIARPRLILADEPTGNLDSAHGEEVMDLLRQLNEEGTTIFMVTHSQRDADYAQRVIRLFDGQVVSENIRTRFIV
jgi:putative ABC transport system ATP-binding protein